MSRQAGQAATPAQLREARGWIADCEWGDLTRASIRRLTADQVVRGIEAHYCGGWAAFVAECAS